MNCEKFNTFSEFAQERELPFPDKQPNVCHSCSEKCCAIAQKVDFYEFDANTSYEPLFDDVTQQFGMVARGKIQVDKFYKRLEDWENLHNNGITSNVDTFEIND